MHSVSPSRGTRPKRHQEPRQSRPTSWASSLRRPLHRLDVGIAGGSALQTYERLHERRENDIELGWEQLSGLVKFSDKYRQERDAAPGAISEVSATS